MTDDRCEECLYRETCETCRSCAGLAMGLAMLFGAAAVALLWWGTS